jgi:DNA-binding response OmpR family regulator
MIWSAPCSLAGHLLIGREKDGENMAFARHNHRIGAVPDWAHPVATGRQPRVVMPSAVRRSTGLTIDIAAREATVRGHAVALTNQELDLLRVLVSGRRIVWSREKLIESAWKHDSYVTVATVDAVVGALRRKIERDASAPQLILGACDAGYRFVDVE